MLQYLFVLQVADANAAVRRELCTEFYAVHKQLQQSGLDKQMKSSLLRQLEEATHKMCNRCKSRSLS